MLFGCDRFSYKSLRGVSKNGKCWLQGKEMEDTCGRDQPVTDDLRKWQGMGAVFETRNLGLVFKERGGIFVSYEFMNRTQSPWVNQWQDQIPVCDL